MGSKFIFVLIELEIAQAFSLISSTRFALASFCVDGITNVGFKVISVTANFPSTFSIFPTALHSKLMNSNFEFAATSKKVDIKQELTAATNKCSGVHISLIQFGNSGGVATSILSGKIGELNVPFES